MSDFAPFPFLAFMTPTNPADPNAAKSQMITNIGLVVVMFVVMWVLVLRPQSKRAKEQAERLKTLKSGDRVTTSSGLVGLVLTVKEHTLTIRCGDAKLEVLKTAVTEVTAGDSTPAGTN